MYIEQFQIGFLECRLVEYCYYFNKCCFDLNNSIYYIITAINIGMMNQFPSYGVDEVTCCITLVRYYGH